MIHHVIYEIEFFWKFLQEKVDFMLILIKIHIALLWKPWHLIPYSISPRLMFLS